MQYFGVTNKEHYGMSWHFLWWSIPSVFQDFAGFGRILKIQHFFWRGYVPSPSPNPAQFDPLYECLNSLKNCPLQLAFRRVNRK